MIFAALDFFIFFGLILALNWLLKKWPLVWRIFLLLASYVFYGVWGWNFVVILICLSVFNWLFGIYIQRSHKYRKVFLALSVGGNLAVLLYFKYYDFFRTALEQAFVKFGFKLSLAVLYIVLPVGLSFYIFRAISYCVDIYRKKYEPEKSLLDFALYMAFFPQLLSGPIARADQFLPQLKNGGAKNISNPGQHIFYILMGLFKKLVVSSWLTILVVDNVFAVPANYGTFEALLAVLAFTLTIYCDFSGYSEIAIGVAGLLGFESPINFDYPYLSRNIQDFWRRWHISLSSWFRDYLYIPLGGNRVGMWRYYFNLFLVMVVSGLWHGAGWPFIIWGVCHGLGSVFYALTHHNKKTKYFLPSVAWIFNFLFVALAWIFFRSPDLATATEMFGALARFRLAFDPAFIGAVWYLVLGMLLVATEKAIKEIFCDFYAASEQWLRPIAIALLAILIVELSPSLIPPFIYFSF